MEDMEQEFIVSGCQQDTRNKHIVCGMKEGQGEMEISFLFNACCFADLAITKTGSLDD